MEFLNRLIQMKKAYKNCSLAIFLATIAVVEARCRKFVEIDPPSTQAVTTSVFSDNAAATAALTVIYSEMQSESFNMSQCAGLLSDELVSYSTNTAVRPYYTNSLLPTSNPGPWVAAYKYIYQANAVMEGLQMVGGVSPAVQKQLTGEAAFIRAFWYFYLVNCYGDVPLATTTDYKVNSTLNRTTKDKVYQQIISDLKDAKNLLNNDYVDANDTTITQERIRPNKSAAAALLARVYLYSGDYPNAEVQATGLISNERYGLVNGLDSVFLKNSREAIWQLGVPSPSNYNTFDGYCFILQSAPNNDNSANTATISRNLSNSFEPGDKRKVSWIGAITYNAPDTTYYFPFKYKNRLPSPITEYTMMLRLAEQYFIRAEAIVQQNKDLNMAVADLNVIRERAGLQDYVGPLDKNSLLTAILHERQVELFTEWGHRWFDLIRMGSLNTIMSLITPQKGGVWKSEWSLFPIPQSERNIDFNLSQNVGY